jgi:hypothetical protein
VLVREVDVDAVLGDVDDSGLQRRVDLAERHVDGLRAVGREVRVLGLGRLHADLLALDVVDRLHLLLAVHVAKAHREEPQHLRALNLVLDEGAELGRDRRVGERLLQVRLVAEQEMEREDAGLRRHRRRIGGRRDDEIDVAGAQLLQHLRLLAELAARELLDGELAARELLQLGVEDVGRDAVRGRRRLVVGEAELARRLGARCARGERQQRERERPQGRETDGHGCLLSVL